MANMTVFDVIDRLRAAWRFKTDPVPEEAIRRILEAATKAASGATFSALGIPGSCPDRRTAASCAPHRRRSESGGRASVGGERVERVDELAQHLDLVGMDVAGE